MTRLPEVLHRARMRSAANLAGVCAPLLALACVFAWRWQGASAAVGVGLVLLVAGIALARRRVLRLDTAWLLRTLDARRPDLEDSSDLLFASPAAMTPLERLQRTRLEQRLATTPTPDLRAPWRARTIAATTVLAVTGIAGILAWPAREPVTFDNVLSRIGVPVAAPTHTRILAQSLQLTPPAYTRQPASTGTTLDAKAPQGTRLHWTIRLHPQPASAALVFHDGRRVPLARTDDGWEAGDVLARSALYRLVIDDAPPLEKTTLHRLDAIADRAPEVRVLQPERGLVLMRKGQRAWSLAFEARDDYGLAPTGRLRVTVAHGSGENIAFREIERRVGGSGAPTARRFHASLDLGALGLEEGDDLIVQLRVDDTRSPNPQSARSASVILRWPPDTGSEATGVDAQVRKVLPAYFRSQRQIIMDAEALLKQKSTLSPEAFAKRSDEIGVDQRILRLRYGQFLGEEAAGEPQAPPTNDQPAASDDHAHEGEPPATPPALGQDAAVEQQFGHTHDEAEAATLLDPETRATLKQALDQMWQSELHLRQAAPEDALPYAYRALGFIKEVQQATRIYMARVGSELPPIDESRRMSGDRKDLGPARPPIVAAPGADPVLASLWQALDDTQPGSVDFPALERWLRGHQAELRDPLAFFAAIERLRAQPRCLQCRRDLRALLWPLLRRPAAGIERRRVDDAQARRYLDALRDERAP